MWSKIEVAAFTLLLLRPEKSGASSLTPAREANAEGEPASPSGVADAEASESQLVPIGADNSCEVNNGMDEKELLLPGGKSEEVNSDDASEERDVVC